MVHPLAVHDAQQQHALDLSHALFADLLLLGLVEFLEHGHAVRVQDVAVQHLQLFVRVADVAEIRVDGLQTLVQLVPVPALRVFAGRGDVVQDLGHLVLHHAHDVLAQVFAVEHAVSLVVDDGALAVHDVVVLQNVFPDAVVAPFHLLLRVLDRAGQKAGFQLLVLTHAEARDQALHLLAAEQAHQVVVQRHEELGAARVSLTAGTAAQLVVDTSGFVALRADDVQTAQLFDPLLFGLPLFRELFQQLAVFRPRLDEGGIGQRHEAAGVGDRLFLVALFLHLFLRFEVRVAAQDDVGTAARHVRRDGDGAFAAGLRDDLSFAHVLLRVQHVMGNAAALQHGGQDLRLFHGDGADQHRLTRRVMRLDLVAHRVELAALRRVDRVFHVLSGDGAVRGDHDDLHVVDIGELRLFRLRRTGHAGQLLVHAEVILQRDGRQRLRFAADLDAFLGFDGLVQTVGIAASEHETSGELVHDDDLAVLFDIVHVALHDVVRLQGDVDVVVDLHVLRVGEVFDVEVLFALGDARLRQGHGAVLLVHGEVAGGGLGAAEARVTVFDDLSAGQRAHEAVRDLVQIRGFRAHAGDDQRRSGLVDQDGVDLVHDGVVELSLHLVLLIDAHVVSQIVETELVVRSVRDIGQIGFAALVRRDAVDDAAHGESQERVELAHPFHVALGQIIVDRHHVHAVAGERVQVNGQRRDQRFAFACLHFGDVALVQHDAADELYAEML